MIMLHELAFLLTILLYLFSPVIVFIIHQTFMGIYNWTTIFYGREIDVENGTPDNDCDALIINGKHFRCVKGSKIQFDSSRGEAAFLNAITDLSVCDFKRDGFQWFSQTDQFESYRGTTNKGDVTPCIFPPREKLEELKKQEQIKKIGAKYNIRNAEELNIAIAELNYIKTLL